MKILIAGDFCPRDRIHKLIEEGKGKGILEPNILSTIKDVDYSIVNYECPVADNNAIPIPKCGPNLRCTSKGVDFIKDAGFQCVTLANNHFRDFGDEGVGKTLETLKSCGIDYVGGGMNIPEATQTLYKEINGETLAIINVCENEFSIADQRRGGAAPLDTIDVVYRIREAKNKAKYVLAIIHGGHEHFQYPSPRMIKLYRFFIEEGASAVVNHHQHCYSGYEEYMGKPIFYGLGNFCFDHPKKRGGIWNEGYMVSIEFRDKDIKFELYPYIQCDENPSVKLMEGIKLQDFENSVSDINKTIINNSLLQRKYNEFVSKKSPMEITPFTPYFSEYTRVAAGRNYIPYMIPRKKLAKMLNFIMCEAHRDILIESMRKRLENE